MGVFYEDVDYEHVAQYAEDDDGEEDRYFHDYFRGVFRNPYRVDEFRARGVNLKITMDLLTRLENLIRHNIGR